MFRKLLEVVVFIPILYSLIHLLSTSTIHVSSISSKFLVMFSINSNDSLSTFLCQSVRLRAIKSIGICLLEWNTRLSTKDHGAHGDDGDGTHGAHHGDDVGGRGDNRHTL